MGRAVAVSRTDHSAGELRAMASKCSDADQVRRLLAIALVLDGASRGEAARQSGMDRQTLRDWVHRYNAEGIGGLQSRISPGRPPKLTTEQKAEFRALVIAGPDPALHGVVRWRCVHLQEEAARQRPGSRQHDGQVAAQARADPAATAPLSSQEGCQSRGGV